MKKIFNFAVILKTLNMNPGHFWGLAFFACGWPLPIKVYFVQPRVKSIIENCEEVQFGGFLLFMFSGYKENFVKHIHKGISEVTGNVH